MLGNGYVRTYVEDADKTILNGQTSGLWQDSPSMVVHPEVGKWLIALGEKGFGMDPFGWRIAAAVVGSLMVLLMCRFVRRVTGSTALGLVGGLLLALDGLQLVLSRLALLDIFLAFFILLRSPLCRGRPTMVPGPPREGRDPGAVPALAARGRGGLRAGDRHQVDGAVPARGLRPAADGVELRRPPGLRAPAGTGQGPPRRRPDRLRQRGARGPGRLRDAAGPAG